MADLPKDRFVLFTRSDGKWGWRLIVNSRIVATDGGQGYENRGDADKMGNRIVNGEFKDVPRYVETKDKDKK